MVDREDQRSDYTVSAKRKQSGGVKMHQNINDTVKKYGKYCENYGEMTICYYTGRSMCFSLTLKLMLKLAPIDLRSYMYIVSYQV